MGYYSGIGYFTDKVLDLFKYKAEGKDRFNVVLAARLSGKPHIGTLINFMVGYRLAYELNVTYDKPVKIVIELLDNISDEKISEVILYDNQKYFHKQLIDNSIIFQHRYEEFCKIIDKLGQLYDVSTEVKTYKDIQQDKRMRQAISEVLENQKYFGKILNPKDGRLHVRIPCPTCGLIEKSCQDVEVEQLSKNEFSIKGLCPKHGAYQVYFSPNNEEYIDINIPLRHFCKGLTLVDDDEVNNSLSIQVLGNDWSGVWPIRVFCEGMVHLRRLQLPTFLFSPLVIKNQSKISKSQIEKEKISHILLDVNELSMKQLDILWKEVGKWFQHSENFFDNYDSNYFERILNINEEI